MVSKLRKSLLVAVVMVCGALTITSIVPISRAFQDKPVLTEDQKKLVNAVTDQVKSGEQGIQLAEPSRRSANSQATVIIELSNLEEADEIAMRKLEELATAISSVSVLNLPASLDDHKTRLETVKIDLTAARDALPAAATGQPEEIGVARKAANDEIARLEKQIKAQTDTRKKLADALAGVPGKVKDFAELFQDRLAALSAIDKAAEATALLPALPGNFATLVEVERDRRLLRKRWKDVSGALTRAGSENEANNTAVLTALDDLDTEVIAVLNKLETWLGKLAIHAQAETAKTGKFLPDLIANPVEKSPEAMSLVSTGSELHGSLTALGAEWIKLAAQLQGLTIVGFDLTKTSLAAQVLAEADKSLNISVAVLQDGLTGDASEFIADQVSLYYFTDVPRIMKMLNSATYEVGGIKGAKERAALERQRLTITELDLDQVVAEVSKAQQRVIALQEELRQSKSAFNVTTDQLRSSSRNLKGVQTDHQKNVDRLTSAQTELDANPTDPEKRLARDRATEERDKSAARLLAAEQRNEDATRERDAAKERNDVLANEQAGLPARIQQAKDQLEIAQSAVARQRRAAFLSAQAESEAFALARDNTPFWFAPAIA